MRALAAANEDDDDDNDDFVPNYMTQLFHDAESAFQNALASLPHELTVDERERGKISEVDGDGVSFFNDENIEPSGSATSVTAEGARMPTAAEGNDDERVEKEERLAAAETAKHDGQIFFAAQGHMEKETVVWTELDSIGREGSMLKQDLAEIGLKRVEKEYSRGDNSLLNDTFDTAFCSLGAIERAVSSSFDEKERMGEFNASSTVA